MRKNAIDNVEIVEPPIQELTKKRSGFFKRTCLTGCGCVFIFIFILLIIIRLAIGPGPKTFKEVPGHFPKNIPIYDRESIKKITFIEGKYKNRRVELSALVPKLLLSSLFDDSSATDEDSAPAAELTPLERRTLAAKKIWRLIRTPVGDSKDTVQIQWKNINAEPNFVASYYQNELRKSGYTVKLAKDEVEWQEYSFNKADGITGNLVIKDAYRAAAGTDAATLTVNISSLD